MCREDLELAKRRFAKPAINNTGGVSNMLTENNHRVALVISWSGTHAFDSTGALITTDLCEIFMNPSGGKPFNIALGPNSQTIVLRIEDVGDMITGPLTAVCNNQTGFGILSVTEIVTDLEVAPYTGDRH